MTEKTRILLNSVGNPVEYPDSASPAANLPTGEFSSDQAELSRVSMPFRKLIRDPFLCEVAAIARTTPIDRDAIQAKKCTSFHVVNPNECYVRLRSSTGQGDDIADGQGWCWPPGFVGIYSTQYPTFVSVIAVARPGVPIPATLAPVELSYGIGGG